MEGREGTYISAAIVPAATVATNRKRIVHFLCCNEAINGVGAVFMATKYSVINIGNDTLKRRLIAIKKTKNKQKPQIGINNIQFINKGSFLHQNDPLLLILEWGLGSRGECESRK